MLINMIKVWKRAFRSAIRENRMRGLPPTSRARAGELAAPQHLARLSLT
jgi:hypothetical protein